MRKVKESRLATSFLICSDATSLPLHTPSSSPFSSNCLTIIEGRESKRVDEEERKGNENENENQSFNLLINTAAFN